MPTSVNAALRYIRALFAARQADGHSDHYLLEQFVSRSDESAFAALLQRHGPMAMGACLRILRDEHLAEDALQATFLVLAVKAGKIRDRGSLANWIYGVALRLARKVKAQAVRSQRTVEREQPEPPASTQTEASRREEQTFLDEELARLPDKYRLPLLLCYFEGRTQEEAAAQLGWTPGRVKGMLDRGRERLRYRLSRRGVAMSAAGLAALLGETVWAGVVSPLLVVPTVKAAMNLVSGTSLAECGVSAAVVTLVKGGLSMYPKKLVLVLALLLFGVGAALWAANTGVDPNARGPEQLVLGERKLQKDQEKEQPKSGVKEDIKWPGEWIFKGQPCAIFQHGRVLLLINDRGDIATGRITAANKFVVLKGWEGYVEAELVDKERTISWGNGSKWTRP